MNFQQHRLLMDSTEIEDRSEWGVLVALIYFADKDTAEAWPGMEKLAEKARMTVRGTEKILKRLHEKGLISTVSEGGGKCKTTVFKVHIEKGTGSYTPNAVQGIEDPNPEPHSVNGVPKESYTPNPVRKSISIPRTPFAPHIEESKNRNEEVCMNGRADLPAEGAPAEGIPKIVVDGEDAATLAGICSVKVSSPSPKDLESWPEAVATVREVLPDDLPGARADKLRAFQQWWFSTPTRSGNPKTRIYLSHISNHFRGFIASRPQSNSFEAERAARHAQRYASSSR